MKIFNKPPKSGHLRISDNFELIRRCPLFRGLTVVNLNIAKVLCIYGGVFTTAFTERHLLQDKENCSKFEKCLKDKVGGINFTYILLMNRPCRVYFKEICVWKRSCQIHGKNRPKVPYRKICCSLNIANFPEITQQILHNTCNFNTCNFKTLTVNSLKKRKSYWVTPR